MELAEADLLFLETSATGLLLLSAGSWPETSWKPIAAQAVMNAPTEPATARLRIFDNRCRRRANSFRALSRAS